MGRKGQGDAQVTPEALGHERIAGGEGLGL